MSGFPPDAIVMVEDWAVALSPDSPDPPSAKAVATKPMKELSGPQLAQPTTLTVPLIVTVLVPPSRRTAVAAPWIARTANAAVAAQRVEESQVTQGIQRAIGGNCIRSTNGNSAVAASTERTVPAEAADAARSDLNVAD